MPRRSAQSSRIKSSTDTNEDDEYLQRKGRQHNHHHHRFRKDRSFIGFFNANLKILFGVSILSFVIIVLSLVRHIMKPIDHVQKPPRVVTPFPAPKLMDLPQFQGDHEEALYWGTYRPHLYLGIRARTPRSLLAGMMWIGLKDGTLIMRHVCQDADGLSRYGWTHHNARDYGHQVIVDQHLILATSFLKSNSDGSGYGGDWAVRIDMQTHKLNEQMSGGHLFFYLADEDDNALSLNRDSLKFRETSLLASGSRADVGRWQLYLQSADDLEIHYSGFKTLNIHNLSELVQETLREQARKLGRIQLPDTLDDTPNVLVFQISGKTPFKTDIAFVSGTSLKTSRTEERLNTLRGDILSTQLKKKQQEFDEKFERCFNLTNKLDSDSLIVGKAAIGNLLGGIGYFYGKSIIKLPNKSDVKGQDDSISYWPAELYTAVPSRSVFPRGFLWDEGFHLLLIWRWDLDISLDIMGHWLDLMNIEGWIPREQILGAEAISKVPADYVAQHPTNANPPTLFLVIHDLIDGMKTNKFTSSEVNRISSFLERGFVRLEAWFQWFNTTQSGKDTGSYYWHGRDNTTTRQLNPQTLTSGLDDYPRASHPTEDERHLDLRCWMLLAANCMQSITELSENKNESEKDYGSTAKLLSDFGTLNKMHFDESYGTYFDFGSHTEKVRLKWKDVNTGNNHGGSELVREVLEEPELRFVPHIGYVNLFPFMGRIIPPDSWILEKQLDVISNRSLLWTDYGLRSLAKTSSLYMKHNTEHDAPYWRGQIWMNMNYRILSALHHYCKVDGPYKERAQTVYGDLRNNLIRNVVQNYQQTGYIWEQYEQEKGIGKGAHPFTGWTSLVVLIMAETYSEI